MRCCRCESGCRVEIQPRQYREELEVVPGRFSLKYILAIMNSKFAADWIQNRRRGKIDIYPDDWKDLRIADATILQQDAIVTLVTKCLDAGGVNCGAWEKEIDDRVAALYGL